MGRAGPSSRVPARAQALALVRWRSFVDAERAAERARELRMRAALNTIRALVAAALQGKQRDALRKWALVRALCRRRWLGQSAARACARLFGRWLDQPSLPVYRPVTRSLTVFGARVIGRPAASVVGLAR